MIPRIQAFEFEDLPWLPDSLRRVITDVLGFFLAKTDTYRPAVGLLNRVLRITGQSTVLDLCSGSGATAKSVVTAAARESGREIELIFSDKYPRNPNTVKVDVLNGADAKYKVRTMFTALHHFRPEDVQAILKSHTKDGAALIFCEFTERSLKGLFFMLIGFPVIFLCAPFIKPFSWSRLFWVYMLPVSPFVLFWDGCVSALRSYRPKELLKLAQAVPDYHWSSGKQDDVTYLIGYPKSYEDKSSPA